MRCKRLLLLCLLAARAAGLPDERPDQWGAPVEDPPDHNSQRNPYSQPQAALSKAAGWWQRMLSPLTAAFWPAAAQDEVEAKHDATPPARSKRLLQAAGTPPPPRDRLEPTPAPPPFPPPETPSPPEPPPPPSPPPPPTCLESVRATGVQGLDEGTWGTSDPQLWVYEQQGGSVTDRTEIRYNALNPSWSTTIYLQTPPDVQVAASRA